MLIFALIDERNTAPAANMGPLLIGVLIIAIGESFGSNSGWAINPARDFGPRLFSYLAGWGTAFRAASGSVYFWVPIVGPLIGGVLGTGCTTCSSAASCPPPRSPVPASRRSAGRHGRRRRRRSRGAFR
jgi:glycerol uptake facilitator protein